MKTMNFPAVKQSLRSVLGTFFAGSVLLLAMPAHAGLFEDEDARRAILDLRKQIQLQAQQAASRGDDLEKLLNDQNLQNAPLRRGLLDLQNQLDASLAETARLRGSVEQLQREVNELRRSQSEVKELGVGIDPKLQNLEQRLARLEPIKTVVDGLEVAVEPDEKRDYEQALATFRSGDYVRAQKQFSEFLMARNRSAYAPSALFWLANAQYATRDVREALQNYRTMVARAPMHPRAPEAQLGLANSFLELKDTKSARKALEDLVRNYPQSEAAQSAAVRLQTLK
jgi:tol-pal system protein YbgF